MSWVRIPPEAAHFSLEKKICLGCCCVVLYCVALYVVSFDHVYNLHVRVHHVHCMYIHVYIRVHCVCVKCDVMMM